MFVQKVKIENINGIKDLSLPFHRYMNLICGPNGIGKSTILDSIGATFSNGNRAEIKRFLQAESGRISVDTGGSGGGHHSINVNSFHPTQASLAGTHNLSNFIFALKTNRNFSYEPLKAIGKDPVNDGTSRNWVAAQVGISLTDTKNWFVNRFLYSAHTGSLNEAQIENFALAKKCFSLLNPSFEFATVDASTNEILVDTPTGRIYFEYLSSGFKSCLTIMFAMIKEIEYRFPNLKAGDMEGIALIDEVEIHLHPEWQSKIAEVLRTVFQSMQFIVSTHSPHVIQNAEPDTVVALESVDGNVVRRDLNHFTGTFKGWTVEEVLEDVMRMPDTRTAKFNDLATDFGSAIDAEDADLAVNLYRELDCLLHPKNSFRKIARLQLASIGVKLDQAGSL